MCIVPRSIPSARVRQSTTCCHDGRANPLRQEADRVLPNAVPFDATTRVFDPDSAGRERTLGRFCPWGECTTPGGGLGLNDGHPLSRPPLPPHLWIATTPGGQGIASQICHALLRGLACTGGAQAPTGTGFVAAQPVVARGARLLPAGIVLWRRGICRARARPFGPLRPTRGDGDSPVARTVLRRAATSPAGRAGSRACWAQARFNTAWRR